MRGEDGAEARVSVTLVRKITIKNKYGIHARPAAMFVKTAGQYGSEITVQKEEMEVSGKSIMGLLTLEAYQGVTLKVTAVGADAESALEALAELVKTKFNED